MLNSPMLHVGDRIDRYLQREGALAQAVDAVTLLVSSEVLRMHPRDRSLILLHEQAHLAQLSRPGSDPVCALEAEAWAAAHAWSEGRPFRIRGRARGRLNAVALIQGGPKGHPHAPAWYSASPEEPIGAKSTITVESTVLLEQIDLEVLLDQIIGAKASDIVIVSHGDGNGLALPLRKGATAGAEKAVIDVLAADKSVEILVGGQKIRTPVTADSRKAPAAIGVAQLRCMFMVKPSGRPGPMVFQGRVSRRQRGAKVCKASAADGGLTWPGSGSGSR